MTNNKNGSNKKQSLQPEENLSFIKRSNIIMKERNKLLARKTYKERMGKVKISMLNIKIQIETAIKN